MSSNIVPAKNVLQYLRLFFAIAGAHLLFRTGDTLVGATFKPEDLLWPVAWMQWLPSSWFSFLPYILYIACGINLTFVAWRPQWRISRISAAILLLALLALDNSLGKISNSVLGWPLCALMLSFCKIDDSDFWQKMNQRLIQAAGGIFLSFYFVAGLSKAWSFILVWRGGESFASIFANYVPRIAGIAFLQNQSHAPLAKMFYEPGIFTSMLFFGLLVVELGSLIPILRPRQMPLWGGLIILFHLCSLLFLGIGFSSAALLAVVILILNPTAEL